MAGLPLCRLCLPGGVVVAERRTRLPQNAAWLPVGGILQWNEGASQPSSAIALSSLHAIAYNSSQHPLDFRRIKCGVETCHAMTHAIHTWTWSTNVVGLEVGWAREQAPRLKPTHSLFLRVAVIFAHALSPRGCSLHCERPSAAQARGFRASQRGEHLEHAGRTADGHPAPDEQRWD